VDLVDLGTHLELCCDEQFPATESRQYGSPEAGGLEASFGLGLDDEAWATAQIARLHRSFGVGSLDEFAAFATLLFCSSATELRIEAMAIIADKQPVKNFAAELWRRRQQATAGRIAVGSQLLVFD